MISFSDLNEESLEVNAALFLEFLSRIKNKPTIKSSKEANCIAVWRSYIPCQVLKIPVVKVWIAKWSTAPKSDRVSIITSIKPPIAAGLIIGRPSLKKTPISLKPSNLADGICQNT